MTPQLQMWSLILVFFFPLMATVSAVKLKEEIRLCPQTNKLVSEEVPSRRHCWTLQEYYCFANITSDTTLILEPGQHLINKSIELSNWHNIEIKGEDNTIAIINCSKSGALSFRFCSNIILSNLHITQCGSKSAEAAVYFYNDSNVELVSVTISNSFKSALRAENVNGSLSLLNCIIRDIEPELHNLTSNTSYRGNAVIYNECDTINTFLATKSIFSNKKYFNNPLSTSGLTIKVSCDLIINITECTFTSNADINNPGGNLKLIMDNISNQHFVVHLLNVNISNGRAYRGGGIHIKMAYNRQKNYTLHTPPKNNRVLLENVLIQNNTANYSGGGVYISQEDYENARVYHNTTFKHCNFTQNIVNKNSSSGAAIHSNSFILPGFRKQTIPQYTIKLSHCHFYYNGRQNTREGNSVIVINAHKYVLIESINVTKNFLNAITAINSNLIFSGSSYLTYNNGSSGGGLLLCENGILYFEKNTNLHITNNNVSHAGGGICVQPQCLEASPRCFFQIYQEYNSLNELNITITVKNNYANYSGHNIYGGDVDRCYLLDTSKPPKERHAHNNFSEKLFHKMFDYSDNCSSVTSPPRKVLLCDSSNIIIYPGMKFPVQARLLGQLNGSVPGVIVVAIDNTNLNNKNAFQIDSKDSNKCNCSTEFFTINTTSPNKFRLTLIPEHSGDNSGFHKTYGDGNKHLNVTVLDCPDGSNLNTSTHICDSIIPDIQIKFSAHATTSATSSSYMFETNNSSAWFEISTNKSVNYKKFCPLDYCNLTQKVFYHDSSRCQNNRNGTLCGKCASNYSAMLGTSKCGKCTNNYYILLVVPFALLGVFLVIFLTVTNLTVAEGTLSGLLFYANVIESNSLSLYPLQCTLRSCHFLNFLKMFIGWLNLDLAIPTCFYNGMTPYVEAWLDFIFPIYIWVLSALIIRLSSKHQWIAKLASKNATKVLATLVLLSYTRFLRAIIFNFSNITYEIISVHYKNTSTALWLVDPNIPYWSKEHKVIFLFSLIFALICVPFMLVLVFIRTLPKYSHFRLFRWIMTLKPFLDAFTGPYTDHGRIWPGLLLVARAGISITAGMNSLNDPSVKLGITVLVIICLLIIAAFMRPGLYSNKWLDLLEYFFLLNLCIICLGKGYSVHIKQDCVHEIVFQLSAGSSFMVFSGIVGFHIWLLLRRLKCTLVVTNWIVKKHIDMKKLINNDKWSKNLDNYPPRSADISHEREPLIADHEE